jgi:hypothetical protein
MSKDDQKTFLTVVGPEEVIRALSTLEKTEGFSVGEPQPVDSLADAVDSVLGPDEIKQLMEFATVMLQFGTATIAFISALKTQLATVDTTAKRQVHVLDGRTNDEILIVDESTDEAAAKKAIESSTTK